MQSAALLRPDDLNVARARYVIDTFVAGDNTPPCVEQGVREVVVFMVACAARGELSSSARLAVRMPVGIERVTRST